MMTLDQIIKATIEDRLLRMDGNKTAVAESLGVTLKTLYNMMERHGIRNKGELRSFPGMRRVKEERNKTKEAIKSAEIVGYVTYSWEDDPNFDTGYEEPTHEERDAWYNQDYQR